MEPAAATLIRCIGQVPGCPRCAQESLRGADEHVCDELCALQREVRAEPERHASTHEPLRHSCGTILDDRHGNNYEQVEVCGWGTCMQVYCPGCRAYIHGYGPTGCRCEVEPCGHGTYASIVGEPPVRLRGKRRFSLRRR